MLQYILFQINPLLFFFTFYLSKEMLLFSSLIHFYIQIILLVQHIELNESNFKIFNYFQYSFQIVYSSFYSNKLLYPMKNTVAQPSVTLYCAYNFNAEELAEVNKHTHFLSYM